MNPGAEPIEALAAQSGFGVQTLETGIRLGALAACVGRP